MRSFSIADRRLVVEISARCAFPAYLKSAFTPAVAAALRTMPKARLHTALPQPTAYTLGITLLSPTAIRRLNKKWRQKDRPTDVLSFSKIGTPLFPGIQAEIGDLAICWKIAKGQTETFGTTVRGELQRLVVHGVLHLFGYDHETGAADARRMFRLQERALASLA